MGRRSRNRSAEAAAQPVPAARADRRRARLDAAPPAPWGSFPLAELCVLLGVVLCVLGVILWGDRGPVMLLCGLALASVAGLELSIREHFAGYRSHSAVIAGTVALVVLTLTAVAKLPLFVDVALAAAVFATAAFTLREIFQRRSDGWSWR
jgi:lysylphosphatidylglycerol synthetase-like protein (DUF2156 family)